MPDPFVHSLVLALALIGAVIVIAALLSGLVERSGIPQVMIFLALGAAVGPVGLGVLDVPLDSPALQTVATLSPWRMSIPSFFSAFPPSRLVMTEALSGKTLSTTTTATNWSPR